MGRIDANVNDPVGMILREELRLATNEIGVAKTSHETFGVESDDVSVEPGTPGRRRMMGRIQTNPKG